MADFWSKNGSITGHFGQISIHDLQMPRSVRFGLDNSCVRPFRTVYGSFNISSQKMGADRDPTLLKILTIIFFSTGAKQLDSANLDRSTD
jgi:hypothetical protein